MQENTSLLWLCGLWGGDLLQGTNYMCQGKMRKPFPFGEITVAH